MALFAAIFLRYMHNKRSSFIAIHIYQTLYITVPEYRVKGALLATKLNIECTVFILHDLCTCVAESGMLQRSLILFATAVVSARSVSNYELEKNKMC